MRKSLPELKNIKWFFSLFYHQIQAWSYLLSKSERLFCKLNIVSIGYFSLQAIWTLWILSSLSRILLMSLTARFDDCSTWIFINSIAKLPTSSHGTVSSNFPALKFKVPALHNFVAGSIKAWRHSFRIRDLSFNKVYLSEAGSGLINLPFLLI